VPNTEKLAKLIVAKKSLAHNQNELDNLLNKVADLREDIDKGIIEVSNIYKTLTDEEWLEIKTNVYIFS
jgi:hypothetical protein